MLVNHEKELIKQRTVYFYVLIEVDLMLMASISLILNKVNPSVSRILILPEHTRVAGFKMEMFFNCFDEVIRFPFYSVPLKPQSVVASIKHSKAFQRSISYIDFHKDDCLLMFDCFKFNDLILLNHFKKRGGKIAVISSFVGNQFNIKNLQVVWAESFMLYILSSFFAGKRRMYFTKRRESRMTGYYITKDTVDFTIQVEGSNRILNSNRQAFVNLPYPLHQLTTLYSSYPQGQKSVLFLVSSIHGKRWENYWSDVIPIIKEVVSKDIKVFIKDHPNTKSDIEKYILSDKIHIVDNTLNAEQIYLNPSYNVVCVIGYGSTALVTASWFNIKTLNYSKLVNYPAGDQSYYNDFLQLGKNIENINSLQQIVDLDIENLQQRNQMNDKKWEDLLDSMIKNE